MRNTAKILQAHENVVVTPLRDSPLPLDSGRLSEDLRQLTEIFGERKLTLREVIRVTQGRGYDLILIMLSLPFLTPIPFPLLSVPFGTACMLIGIRLFFGRRPWLPAFLLNREISRSFSFPLLKSAEKLLRFLELFVRPRFEPVTCSVLAGRFTALMISILGLLLLLPLTFVPLSNFLPALSIFLLSAALPEKDGLCLLLGCAAFTVSLGYFAFLFFGSAHLFRILAPI